MDSILIREIKPADNPAIAAVIRNVLLEYNVPKVGTAYADPQLDFMCEAYDKPNAVYYVVENNGKIIGGAGISQLENEAETICELQKMYFLPEARGLGLGNKMMDRCLTRAKEFGYEKCYLETMPYMEDAQKLYKKSGFDYLCGPMGNTGHTSCPVWMIKEL
ncbi:GNAT family N-acetyltransferase [Flavobacterium sp. GT3R68]|uniref:GNAT family N-acetyltransferase n=1 Tax=Flavobacterium sp. GT3R68 TaxID=2594437 RepID=UPI000F85D382|nr:GNAT family N-acetyltransferase [Flavobacterium sp. GT3R68]RTY88570.1 GNAT family N-acetyltransferase [Flavobacterium sp. GSN2]TRW90603.1 GNAT family N-acetyltransferase [Flavobacterium sp. GT3R68]